MFEWWRWACCRLLTSVPVLLPLQSAGCDVTVYQNEKSLGIEVRLRLPCGTVRLPAQCMAVQLGANACVMPACCRPCCRRM